MPTAYFKASSSFTFFVFLWVTVMAMQDSVKTEYNFLTRSFVFLKVSSKNRETPQKVKNIKEKSPVTLRRHSPSKPELFLTIANPQQ